MSSLSAKLNQAVAKNNELLSTLAQTEHADPALKQKVEYINDLQAQLKTTDAELVKLHAITEDERKDHVKYRDSTMKRFAYKLGGSKGKDKFHTKMEKEEREFLEAWQREREAKDRRSELDQALQNADQERQHLTTESEKHGQASKELDSLYQSIFDGPTPEAPEEDAAEECVRKAVQDMQGSSQAENTERAALNALNRAHEFFQAAYHDIDDALKQSERDMFLGSSFFDMMERDALSRSQNNLTQALRHLQEAMKAQPAIRSLTDVNIDQGHFVSDVLFDNIFTDMRQHERILDSERQLRMSIDQLRAQIQEQNGRWNVKDQECKRSYESLTKARKELQQIRQDMFQKHAGGNGHGDVPLSYSVKV